MPEQWFAIRTKSNREVPVCDGLQGKGYDVLFPRYTPSVPGRAPSLSAPTPPPAKPLFPGYLFCKFNPETRLPVLTVPGVLNIVSNGRIPIPLDSDEVESVKVIVASKLPVFPHLYLKAGDLVTITEGPLAGAAGSIVQSDSSKLIVSISLLQRSVAVEVAAEWLKRRPASHAGAGTQA